MTIIFRTPSKRCPNRIYNGRPIVNLVVQDEDWKLRRLPQKKSQVYLGEVERPGLDNALVLCFEDELHIIP